MQRAGRVILIGGSSHVGKTTLAGRLAERPGWSARSTDYLARHPGRPWRHPPDTLPPHVGEHYLSLDVEDLIASVLGHYRGLWPVVETIIREHAEDSSKSCLVLEGSALLPDLVARLAIPGVSAVWLIGDEGLFPSRIHAESRYEEAEGDIRAMIDKFVARTVRFNGMIQDDVARFDLPSITVDADSSVEALAGLWQS